MVGVAPSGFSGLTGAAGVWVTTRTLGAQYFEPDNYTYHVVGRLRRGVAPEQAAAATRVLGGRIDEAFPSPVGSWGATDRPLDAHRVSDAARISVLLLFAAAGLLLLIACANVAGLVVSGSVTRHREMATRLALGAGARRIVRQLLTESLVLSVVSGVLGVAVAYGAVRGFNSIGAARASRCRGWSAPLSAPSGSMRRAFSSASSSSSASR